jgi:peptidoglycan/xylan/chitin deacetylase (PgdA/CDA1 family)
MIRLDNIQAYWCNGIAVELVNEILALGYPINLGVIGNGGEALSADSYIAENMEEWATNPLVEITNAGYSFTSLSGQTLEFQMNDIAAGNEELMTAAVLDHSPITLIPPNGDWDGNTITAMKSESMSIMSTYCIWDPENPGTPTWCPSGPDIKAPNVEVDGVCRLPAGAVLGDVSYWTDNSQPADLFSAVNWVWGQIDQQGFSVLQLKPIEFALDKRSCISMDEDKKKVLKDLLTYGKDQWDFSTFSRGCAAASQPPGPSCPTPPPRPHVTAAPSVTSDATDSPTWSPVAAVTSSPSHTPIAAATRSPTLTDCNPDPVVMFRLDNVKAFWCTDLAISIVKEFTNASMPLNVGIIGKNGHYECSDDVVLTNAISSWQTESTVEIVSNSYEFMYFDGETLAWQSEDLAKAQAEIMELANGYCPISFIPPYGSFDANTIKAMKENNLDVMSSYCIWDLHNPGTISWCPSGSHFVAPHINNDGVYMLPAGAVLGDADYWEDNSLPADFHSALAWVKEQVARQGFSVITLSPIEFATDRGTCSSMDTDKLAVLREVISYARDNWDVQLFQDAKVTLSTPPDCTHNPSSTPTVSPTPAPTPILHAPTNTPSGAPTSLTAVPTASPTGDEECPSDVVVTSDIRTEAIEGGEATYITGTTVTTLSDKVITVYHESCVKSWTQTEFTVRETDSATSSTGGAVGAMGFGWLFAVIFGCTTLILLVYIAAGIMREKHENNIAEDGCGYDATSPSFSTYPREMGKSIMIAMKNPGAKKGSFTGAVGGMLRRHDSTDSQALSQNDYEDDQHL